MKTYTEKDMVDVVDEAGNDLSAIPKAWLGTDLVPAGVKQKSKSSGSSSSSSSSSTPAARQPGEEPKGNASTEEWAAYAREKGATDDDLIVDGKELTRDELKAKYGTPAE